LHPSGSDSRPRLSRAYFGVKYIGIRQQKETHHMEPLGALEHLPEGARGGERAVVVAVQVQGQVRLGLFLLHHQEQRLDDGVFGQAGDCGKVGGGLFITNHSLHHNCMSIRETEQREA